MNEDEELVNKDNPLHQTIRPTGIPSYEIVGSGVTLWKTTSFALDWLRDALNEAKKSNGWDSKRREVVFAVCFAESYFFEWVRDEVLKIKYRELDKYFTGEDRGLRKKWQRILLKLFNDNKIKTKLDLNQAFWNDFFDLVHIRNGLVHAGASRPDMSELPKEKRPKPTLEELQNLHPGWAIRTAINSVKQLHKAADTPPPAWLNEI